MFPLNKPFVHQGLKLNAGRLLAHSHMFELEMIKCINKFHPFSLSRHLRPTMSSPTLSSALFGPDSVDILHLLGVGSYPAPAFHDQQDRWGWDHHHPLPVFPGTLQSSVPHQLDMEVLLWGVLWHDCHRRWGGADHPLLRLLLFVCNKRWVATFFFSFSIQFKVNWWEHLCSVSLLGIK